MSKQRRDPLFRSALAEYFRRYVAEKRALGYDFWAAAWLLAGFDRFLADRGLKDIALPEPLIREWIQKRPNERPLTHRHRVKAAVHMGQFLVSCGVDAFIPPPTANPRILSDFRAHIFTHREIAEIFAASDSLPWRHGSALQHVIFPLILRLLYGCGLRSGEALRLRMKDVDLGVGILTVVEGKFRKDRFVPMAPSLTAALQTYADAHRSSALPEAPFFPAPHGGCYSGERLYGFFRGLLWKVGIPHGGYGKGPRLHDIRHTFAVHRLARWYACGEDLGVLLPALSTYMGHVDLSSTQLYLQMTAEMYPDLLDRVEHKFQDVLPGKEEQ